jgi:hypothetical protein
VLLTASELHGLDFFIRHFGKKFEVKGVRVIARDLIAALIPTEVTRDPVVPLPDPEGHDYRGK